jgi:hypothetical protein
VRELVIVITDLYLPADPAAAPAHLGGAELAGFERLTRFATREHLPGGWRQWLAHWLGRADLAGVAPARIAAAAHPQLSAATETLWLASPVHLSAGLSRVHLDWRGLLRMSADELAAIAHEFGRAFAGSGLTLTPASPGEFLLSTAGIAAVATAEPARFAGADIEGALPRGPEAAGIRRTWAELEMWLHGLHLNQERARRGALPVSALWPWGAQGASVLPPVHSAQETMAFAADAYLRGLWHLQGQRCRAVPQDAGSVLAASDAGRAVLSLEAAAGMDDSSASGFLHGLARLDARYLSPALRAVREGQLGVLRVIANDRCLSVRGGSHLKFWQRPRGLGGFA